VRKLVKVKCFVLGMLVIAMITTAIFPAFAASTTRQLNAVFSNIKIYVDDLLIHPKDGQGNPVEPFIYQGTVYLPVRAVAEALGKPVSWDGATNSVYIGKHDSDTPVVMLNQLDYFHQSRSWFKVEFPKDNLGNTYTEGLTHYGSTASRDYILDGKYSRMRGTFILRYRSRSTSGKYMLKIYGDDKLLYSFSEMTAGVRPVEFEVDLTGVLQMRIEMSTGNNAHALIVDTGLYQ